MWVKKECAPLESTTVYELNGITYVPHYKNRSLFVGPGYPAGEGKPKIEHTHTAEELMAAGAEAKTMMLWPRPAFIATAAA